MSKKRRSRAIEGKMSHASACHAPAFDSGAQGRADEGGALWVDGYTRENGYALDGYYRASA